MVKKITEDTEDFDLIVDKDGRIIITADIAERFGLQPGAKARIDYIDNRLRIRRPVSHLARLYVEPTNQCNLDCVTCIRHSWSEPSGRMTLATFRRIIDGLKDFSAPPDFFFGGLGEPLSHPDIVTMVREAKALGSAVELITNATLLTSEMSQQLIDAGLDTFWTSIDGATPESYKDVRLGAALPQVLTNLKEFRYRRWTRNKLEPFELQLKPQTGIVFVAMKRNIADLPAVFKIATQLGAGRFMVTNVLPYTPELQHEILYAQALKDSVYNTSSYVRDLNLPRLDINPATRETLYQVLRGDHSLTFSGGRLSESYNHCPFIDKGALAIRWDGDASPCLALLHDHKMYFYDYERSIRHHAIGNINQTSLAAIWHDQEHQTLRRRLDRFNFSPCIYCGGCQFFEANQEDCIGSPFPACGGCLWAQGIVQCP